MSRFWETNLWSLLLLAVLVTEGQAATYWVDGSSGDNSNPCTSSATLPAANQRKRTVNAGLACLASGDTLYILNGTYPERIATQVGSPLPSGGGPSSLTTVAGAPGHFPTLSGGPWAGETSEALIGPLSNVDYVRFANFKLDPNYEWSTLVNSDINTGWVMEDMEWTRGFGIALGAGAFVNSRFSRLHIHHTGIFDRTNIGKPQSQYYPYRSYNHAFYLKGGANNIIENCTVHDVTDGYFVQSYDTGTIIRNNTVKNVYATAIAVNGGLTIYNNVFEQTGNVVLKGSNNIFYSNGFLDNFVDVLPCNAPYCEAAEGIYFDEGFVRAYNNLFVGKTGSQRPSGLSFQDAGNNLCDDSTHSGRCTLVASGIDFFVNKATGDYHLRSGTPAEDAGATLGPPYHTDLYGNARGQSGAYDIGPSERVTGGGNTPPGILITIPTSSPNYSTPTTPLTLGGTVSDDGPVPTVTCENARGGGAVPATPSGLAWSVSMALQSGDNVITCIATDSGGLTAQDQITVNLPTLPPAPQNFRMFNQVVAADLDTTFLGDLVQGPGDALAAALRLYRQPNCIGSFVQAGSDWPLSAGTTGITDNDLDPAVTYCWRLRSVDGGGAESLDSNEVRYTAPSAPPYQIASGPRQMWGVLSLPLSGLNRAVPLATGLRHWWRVTPGLDGGVKAADAVSHAHLEFVNMSSTSGWRPTVRPGGAGEWQLASGGTAHLTASTRAGITGPFTVSFWIKEPAGEVQTDFAGIAGQVPDPNWGNGWGLYFQSNKLKCFVEDYLTNVVTSVDDFHPSAWTQVGCTWDGTTIALYLNGVLQGSTAYSGSVTLGNPFDVGMLRDTSATWKGSVDDVKLYTRALAPSQVAGLYAHDQQRPPALEARLPLVPLLMAVLGPPESPTPVGATGGVVRRGRGHLLLR